MRIGITYDLKTPPSSPPSQGGERGGVGLPDDLEEEFDSPATIEAIASVLRGLGHQVEKIGNGRELLERLLADPPEFVFNFAEGRGVSRSREAWVPSVLEMLGIPFTGSDPLTLAVTLDKVCAKRLVQSLGVPVPRGALVGPGEDPVDLVRWIEIPLPLIVKPAWEGSSKGIRRQSLVEDLDQLPAVVANLQKDHRQPVLIEEFIQGDEVTVGMIGNDPTAIIGIMRVLPVEPTERFIYSLEIKREFERLVTYDCPASLPSEVIGRVNQAAQAIFRVLGCRDVARIDFRIRNGMPYFLEVNPLPGLNPGSSDLVILSGKCGWDYPRLIAAIVGAAQKRYAT